MKNEGTKGAAGRSGHLFRRPLKGSGHSLVSFPDHSPSCTAGISRPCIPFSFPGSLLTDFFTLSQGLFLLCLLLCILFVPWVPARAKELTEEMVDGRLTTTLEESLTLEENLTLEGDFVLKSSLNLNGHTLTIQGNALLDADLTLGGGCLAVRGDLHQVDGCVHVNAGLLEVTGDYRLQATDLEDNGSPRPSYGWIKMDDPRDQFQISGDFQAKSYIRSELTDGAMQFCGNVTDLMGNTLKAEGRHLAIFSPGGREILVDLQGSASFQSISTREGAVHFLRLGINQLTEDITLTGDVQEICSPLDLNGHTLTLEGTVKSTCSNLDLNGGKLFVNGNFHQEDPILWFHRGALIIQGDFCLESLEKDESGMPKPSYGWLKMEDQKDLLEVGGDFYARSYNSSLLQNGCMDFKGNVTDHMGNTLRGEAEHKAIFSGTSPQVVDLQNPSACFQSIRTTNERVTFLQLGIHQLTEDIVLSGDIENLWNSLDLNGYQMTLRGSVKLSTADIRLNKGKFTVTGDFLQADPVLYFTGGTLQVEGDYRISSTQWEEDGSSPRPSYGWISMEDPLDHLIVGGEFWARSYNSSLLSAGTMEFKGNVTDVSGNTLQGKGEHRALFSGEGEQIVDLQSSSACFESIRTPNPHVTFRRLGIHTLHEDIQLEGDIEEVVNSLDLNGHTLTLLGSVKAACANLDLNEGVLHVTGDFRLVDPILYFHSGTLRVDGSLRVESPEREEDGLPKPSYGWLKMEEDADRLVVGGEFWARSYNTSLLTAGSMEFGGNVCDTMGNTLRASNRHLAIFSGSGPQVVEFYHSGACFQSVKTINSQVQFKTLGIHQLTEDIFLVGPVEKVWNSLDLNGHTLTLSGDLCALMADLDLNGGRMLVTGHFHHLDPVIWFHGGILEIGGDYSLHSLERSSDGSFGWAYGSLRMENAKDQMIVGGDFLAQSHNRSLLSQGTMEIGGQVRDESGNTVLKVMEDGFNLRMGVGGSSQAPGRDPSGDGHPSLSPSPAPSREPESDPEKDPEKQPEKEPAREPSPSPQPEESPAPTSFPERKRLVKEKEEKRFYLYQSTKGEEERIPVDTWRIGKTREVDQASLTLTGDGGCQLKVAYTPSTSPFAEGPWVEVCCTYEGEEYAGIWEEPMQIVIGEGTEEDLTPAEQELIESLQKRAPSLLPPGIIELGKILFRGYPEKDLKISGYEFAVKEGKDGEWRTQKSTSQEASLSAEFPSLIPGETYWYKYRYYLTLRGKDYYSQWTSGEMGDVYTIYD